MENRFFKVGNVVSPVTGSISTTPLADLAPYRSMLLDFLPFIITTHLGSRWTAEINALGLNGSVPGEPNFSNIVGQVLPYNPFPTAKQTDVRFPLLSVFQTNSVPDKTKSAWFTIQRMVDVVYMFPSFTAYQKERLNPFLDHIERVVVDRLLDSKDDAYNSGQDVLALAGIERLRVINVENDVFKGSPTTDEYFQCITFHLQIDERRMPYTAQFENFSGVDVHIDIPSGSADGGQVSSPYLDLIEVQTGD